jgi:hypothetical protein
LSKFDHPQVYTTDDERALDDKTLERFTPFYGVDWSGVEAVRQLELDKSAGYPWVTQGLRTKGDVISFIAGRTITKDDLNASTDLCQTVFDYLFAHWIKYTPVFSAILKDEIRPLNKEARLFQPAPIQHVVVGAWLFGHQVEGVIDNCLAPGNPITIGLICPGNNAVSLWTQIRSSGQYYYDFDGAAWDSRCNMGCLMSIAEHRVRHVVRERQEFARRYFAVTYRRAINVLGNLIVLENMPSGQFLTAMDNSLTHVLMLERYKSDRHVEFTYFCTGDDLIISARTPLDVNDLAQFYIRKEMYLDYSMSGSKDFYDLCYLGMHPVMRTFANKTWLMYAFREDKLRASFAYQREGSDSLILFSKYVALTILSFPCARLFEEYKKATLEWQAKMIASGSLVPSQSVRSLVGLLLDERRVFKLFTGFEWSPFSSALIRRAFF